MKKISVLFALIMMLALSSTFAFAAEKAATKAAAKSAAKSSAVSAEPPSAPAAATETNTASGSALPAPSPEAPTMETGSQASTDVPAQVEATPEPKSSERAFRFGPTVAIAVPHPLNVGLEGRLHNIAGFAFTYGFLPSMTFSDVSVKMNTWDIRARLFPFQGAFFVGAAYGNQDLTGTRSENILGTAQSTEMKISTTTLTPHIGWRWGSRFVWGFDLGVQLALSHKNTLTTTASAGQQADPAYTAAINDLNKVADDIGSQTLPFITVLHFGFMF